MKFIKSINTEIEIITAHDLPKLKILIEVNNLETLNFSAIARELNIESKFEEISHKGTWVREQLEKEIVKQSIALKNYWSRK